MTERRCQRMLMIAAILSCRGTVDAPTRMVWETYGGRSDPPVTQLHYDVCPYLDSHGQVATAYIRDGRCYAGLYDPWDRCHVAWRGSYHASAFAHELLHAYQWLDEGITDPAHTGPEWRLEGLANVNLASAGW